MKNDTNDILLSVIVPFHNEEVTLVRCADSLIGKSVGVEVIFVDDGSDDGSVSALVAAYPEARIIRHDTNRGTAAALATGYNASSGKYLLRCDADDYFDTMLLDALLPLLIDGANDIVEFGIATHEHGKIREDMPSMSHDLNAMPLSTVNFSLCNHAVRRELILGAPLYEGLDCWEDLSVMARILSMSPSVQRLEGCYYHYIRPADKSSLSVADNRVILSDRVGVTRLLDAFFAEKGLQETYRPFLDRVKFSAKARFLAKEMRDVEAWKSTFPEINRRILSIRHIPLRHRVAFALLSLIP